MRALQSLLLVLLCATGASSYAHDRSESFSEWTWRGDKVHYSFSALQREATRIPAQLQSGQSLGAQLAEYLAEQLQVSSGGQDCTVDTVATALPARKGFLQVEGSFHCAGGGTPTITVNSFFDEVPSHTHYVKVRQQQQMEEFLLTPHQRSHTFTAPGVAVEQSLGGWQAFSRYLGIGAEHILSGADHLAFLIGLMILASGARELAWLVTGFTVGHSLSLGLATLGLASPNSMMVEALIGFTIVLVAAEAMGERNGQLARIARGIFVLSLVLALLVGWTSAQWELVVGTLGAGLFALCYLNIVARRHNRRAIRLLVTSTFGLIHGFGFAGGLLEMEFPVAEMAFVLLGFNLGVELGQLLVLLVVALLILLIGRACAPLWQLRGFSATVTALTGLGTFWFVGRLLG